MPSVGETFSVTGTGVVVGGAGVFSGVDVDRAKVGAGVWEGEGVFVEGRSVALEP